MKVFHALPTEPRVRAMLERDFLWCGLQMLLDEEEELARLCPSCREKAMEERCTCCGVLQSSWQGSINENFDLAQFYQRGKERC